MKGAESMRTYRLLALLGICILLLILGTTFTNTGAQPPVLRPPTNTPIPTTVPPTITPVPPTNTPTPSSTAVGGAGGIQLPHNSGWAPHPPSKVTQTGDVISPTTFAPQGWSPIPFPASVIAGLLQNNVYLDPFYGTNFQ